MTADREPAADTRPGPGQPGHVVTEGRVPGHLAVLARGGRDGRTAALAASRALLDDWEDEDGPRPAPVPVTVLLDGADDVVVTSALLAAHRPAAGRITVHPTPSATGANSLAFDVLAALGRSVTRLGEEKISSYRRVADAFQDEAQRQFSVRCPGAPTGRQFRECTSEWLRRYGF